LRTASKSPEPPGGPPRIHKARGISWFGQVNSLAVALLVGHWVCGAQPAKKQVNLLFIMTDQQRFDAMGCAGNPTLKTPNLDRLAREGARFARAYSSCPVCVPARTTILTGHSPGSTKVISNGDISREDGPNLLTFDQVLLRNGYKGEYHGKWHSPYKFALDYTEPVLWLNGRKPPPGSKATISEAEAFRQYIAEHVPARELRPGERVASLYGCPYEPDIMDPAHGSTNISRERAPQGSMFGCLPDVPPEHSLAAWPVKEAFKALERLKHGPFTLTVSIGPPHPPMVVPKPYFGMYPPGEIPVPVSIGDLRTNSPYARVAPGLASEASRDPVKVRQMISDYYGLVALNDEWIGRLLDRLEKLDLARNTLVVFTSDHGEMLGDHGMMSKMVFYEGSVRIPLLMRLPGVIKPGTVVTAPVSHLDCYATILDYLGVSGPTSEGRSLRPLIEGREDGQGRVAISEWAGDNVPGFMVTDGRWKLMLGRTAAARSVDALYDLKNDPQELSNLLGDNPDREMNRAEAERMKELLVDWLERTKSPLLGEVRARPLLAGKPANTR